MSNFPLTGDLTELTGDLTELNLIQSIAIQDRTVSQRLHFYLGEESSFTLESDVDTSEIEIEIVFEHASNKIDRCVIDNSEIVKSSTELTFTIPAELTSATGHILWAVRKKDDQAVLQSGAGAVSYRAKKDS